jgi:hypothetical protein
MAPKSKLLNTVESLKDELDETEKLAAAAEQWAVARFPPSVPRFLPRHKEIVVKFAFLEGFLAWEAFLDESFTLYLLGEKPPKGRSPKLEHTATRRKDAERLITGADRKYADWTKTDVLRKRSKIFFRRNDPYDSPMKANNRSFEEMKIIRNAIAHRSTHSNEEFKRVVRKFFKTYPPKLTVGKFLRLPVPNVNPPQTFMTYYFGSVVATASLIVPH